MFKYTNQKSEIQFIRKMNWMARQLRYKPTQAEVKLWQCLCSKKLLGYKFRRQHALQHYVADFYCYERKLIVEVDGEVHQHQVEHDRVRDRYLQKMSYQTVRFTNSEVLHNIESVLKKIVALLEGGDDSVADGIRGGSLPYD